MGIFSDPAGAVSNTYGPLTREDVRASQMFPRIDEIGDGVRVLDSPGMAEEQFARRVGGDSSGGADRGHRRGASARSDTALLLTPASPESGPARSTASPGAEGEAEAEAGQHDTPIYPGQSSSTAVLNLSPAGPEANAFPMPVEDDDIGCVDAGVGAGGGGGVFMEAVYAEGSGAFAGGGGVVDADGSLEQRGAQRSDSIVADPGSRGSPTAISGLEEKSDSDSGEIRYN